MDDGFEETLAASTPQVRDLAMRARALIRKIYPAVVEVPWPRQKTIGYGVGPRKMSEHFCYLAIHPSHVNLGFNYGSELPDPTHLLEGPGKLLRHTKITTPANLDNPALHRLIEAATTHRMPARPASPSERP